GLSVGRITVAASAAAGSTSVGASTLGGGGGGGGGGATTLIETSACFPSQAATILAVPSPFAVTVPSFPTVSTFASLLVQATSRPARRLPLLSTAVALCFAVSPGFSVSGMPVRFTFATGRGMTVKLTVTLFPSHSQVILAPPPSTAVTTP